MAKILPQLAISNSRKTQLLKKQPGPSLLYSYIKLPNLYSQFMTKKDQFFQYSEETFKKRYVNLNEML